MTETSIIRKVAADFRARGFRTAKEVWVDDRAIDLVCVTKEAPIKIVAIEAKTEKWRRGLHQASLARLCSDFSYLASTPEVCDRVDIPAAKRLGVGLLSVDGTVSELLAPEPSRFKHKSLCDEALKRF